MISRILMLGAVAITVGCSSIAKQGRIEQFVAPDVNASAIKRVAVIAAGSRRGDMQVLARAKQRMTDAGVPIIKRAGEWESSSDAVKDVCVQKADSPDNVDGIVFVAWDRLVLHKCPEGTVAMSLNGSYAGIDALVDRLVHFMGVTPAPAN